MSQMRTINAWIFIQNTDLMRPNKTYVCCVFFPLIFHLFPLQPDWFGVVYFAVNEQSIIFTCGSKSGVGSQSQHDQWQRLLRRTNQFDVNSFGATESNQCRERNIKHVSIHRQRYRNMLSAFSFFRQVNKFAAHKVCVTLSVHTQLYGKHVFLFRARRLTSK